MGSKYKFLVATDMDYTLLLPGKEISSANLRAAELIMEQGGALTLCTGRSHYLTSTYIDALKIKIPIITSNGAVLYDPVTKEETYSKLIPQGLSFELLSLLLKAGANATCYSQSGLVFLPNSTRREFVNNYNETLSTQDKIPLIEISSASNCPPIDKILLINPPMNLMDDISRLGALSVVSSAKDFYDIMAKDVSKGDGIMKLSSLLSIPNELTFALGDSENDISMLKKAQYGIAIKGSDDKLINEATFIAPSCENDGFARAIEDFILPTIERLS